MQRRVVAWAEMCMRSGRDGACPVIDLSDAWLEVFAPPVKAAVKRVTLDRSSRLALSIVGE
jgi:hypothetical protein